MSVRRENASPAERLVASEDGRFSMESDSECQAVTAGHTETHRHTLSRPLYNRVLSCSLFPFRVHSVSTPPAPMRTCLPPTPPSRTLQVLTKGDTFSIDYGLTGNLDNPKGKKVKKRESETRDSIHTCSPCKLQTFALYLEMLSHRPDHRL
jgi:hypothetical protein